MSTCVPIVFDLLPALILKHSMVPQAGTGRTCSYKFLHPTVFFILFGHEGSSSLFLEKVQDMYLLKLRVLKCPLKDMEVYCICNFLLQNIP